MQGRQCWQMYLMLMPRLAYFTQSDQARCVASSHACTASHCSPTSHANVQKLPSCCKQRSHKPAAFVQVGVSSRP